jgi:TonB-linked SusC/RagA family outer membrane protein
MRTKFFLFLATLFLINTMLFAQNRTVRGKVTSKDGIPLIGATVFIKGTTIGTVSDIDGNYSLSFQGINNPILSCSYIGFIPTEMALGAQSEIDIVLKEEDVNLEDVVVVGYGTQKKSVVTASIAKVTAEEMSKAVATRFEQALQGKVSGVTIVQNSGAPGADLTIKVRGNSSDGRNSPLYIVDGVRVGSLQFINPSDIESVEVMKDAASAAIYGADGGNGIIYITTKGGKSVKGGSSSIEYNFQHSIQKVSNLPSAMDAAQYRTYFMEAANFEKQPKNLAKFSVLDSVGGTNWVSELFQTAPMDEHRLSFSGGTDKSSYFVSGNYLSQDGVVGGDKGNFTSYRFRANFEGELKPWFSSGAHIAYSRMKQNALNVDNGGVVNNALVYQPSIPVFYQSEAERNNVSGMNDHFWNHNGSQYYTKSNITSGEAWNPIAQIDYAKGGQTQDRIVADWHADFKPVSWLKVTSRIFIDYSYQLRNTFNGLTVYGVSPLVADSNTNVVQRWDRWYKYGIENFATFNKQLGDHYVEFMAGQSYENYHRYWLSVTGYDVPYQSEAFAYPRNAQQIKRFGINDESSAPEAEISASYFGRLNYNYKEKILFVATIRRDGSSKFGPNAQFATFPSLSVGYNIIREDYFRKIDALSFVSNLKLRASWGQNGSKQNLGSFPYMTTMTRGYKVSNNTQNLLIAKYPGTPANQGLLWETSEQTDIAADFGFFKNSLTLTVDWYRKVTKDQLASKSDLPFYNGLTGNPQVNSGEIENKGWEFDLNYRNSIGDFKYNVGFNASYLKNKVLAYLPADTAGVYPYKDGVNFTQFGTLNRYEPGMPVWYMIGYEAAGIFQDQPAIDSYVNSEGKKLQPQAKPGDVIFADLNKDGVINPKDIHYLGKPMPDWTFGLSLNGEYKGFDLSLFFQGQTGNQIFFANYRKDRTEFNKSAMWFTNRWTPTNGENKYPRATDVDANQNFRASSLEVYDGDYLRLKNMTIGYTVPEKLSKKIHIARLRVYYTGTNLLTFTKFPGTDPEVGMYDVNANNTFGIDNGLYPPTKINSFGVNIVF